MLALSNVTFLVSFFSAKEKTALKEQLEVVDDLDFDDASAVIKTVSEINEKYNFFDEIIPLEHPRFIMQYNSKHKDEYFEKYLTALNQNHNKKKGD